MYIFQNIVLTLCVFTLGICSAWAADAGLEYGQGSLVIETSAHVSHAFSIEIAQTDAQKEQGLMFRAALPTAHGMIFLQDPPRPASMWMKNTLIPLDMVFIGPDWKIQTIHKNAEPYSLTPIPSSGPVAAVLELAGGTAQLLGLEAGNIVTMKRE